MTERLPQRFRWKDGGEWQYGACLPMVNSNGEEFWKTVSAEGSATFVDDPWEGFDWIIDDDDDMTTLEWIDHDHDWAPQRDNDNLGVCGLCGRDSQALEREIAELKERNSEMALLLYEAYYQTYHFRNGNMICIAVPSEGES